MSSLSHDIQLSNVLARARVSPYFDVERAICYLMESWMYERQEAKQSAERLAGGVLHQPTSVIKIFTWPSREMCACLHKAEEDHLYLFDSAQNRLTQIESSVPFLQPVEHGDRFVLLNAFMTKYLTQNELEHLLQQHMHDPDYILQDELVLRAQVNARAGEHTQQNLFHPWVLKVQFLDLPAS